MSDVQLENGFCRIANEILEKAALLKLSSLEHRITLMVWRYTYGFGRKEHEMSISFLAQGTDSDNRGVQRALKNLETNNIIIQRFEGQKRFLMFNKHHEEWCKEHAYGKNTIGNSTVGNSTNGGNTVETIGSSTVETIGSSTTQERNKEKKKERQSSNDDGPTASNLIKEYHDRFLEKFGAKPMINGGKHGKLLKGLLNNYSYEDIKRYISMYFDDNEDKFIKDSGYSVEAFVTKIQKYVLKKSKPKFEPIDEWAEFERKQQRDLERWG